VRAADALGAAVDALTAAGCETPRLDAEVLIADAMGVDRGMLVSDPDQEIIPSAARLVGERVRRRIQREPVAYILGRKGFRFVELGVDRRVLVPRPETELLVELALALPQGAAVHDVGTGSGAVALALASERPDLRVSASDASAEAVEVARANAARLGLEVPIAHEAGLPAGAYDLVVANLPYVTASDYSRLVPEIRNFEPRMALVAGAEGMDAIAGLVAAAPAGTRLALEHGTEQGQAVRALLAEPETHRDLAGHERVTVGEVA